MKNIFFAPIVSLMLLGCFAATQKPSADSRHVVAVSNQSADTDLEALELEVHKRINDERGKKKIAALKNTKGLVMLARNHSADMAIRNYIAHINPEGESPTDRAVKAKFECQTKSFDGVFPTGIGENIFMSYLYENYEVLIVDGVESRTYNWKSFDQMAREIVNEWMGSKGHKENILRKDYHYGGIGIATNQDYQIFVTQTFC